MGSLWFSAESTPKWHPQPSTVDACWKEIAAAELESGSSTLTDYGPFMLGFGVFWPARDGVRMISHP